MSDLFFYGTLRYAPLLELVLGRDAHDIDMIPATLADHAVYAVNGHPFPMIAEAKGQAAEGLLVRGLSETDIARLTYYEGGFDYDLETHQLDLETGEHAKAQVFFPEPGLWQRDGLWSLEAWIERWGQMSLYAADEVMAFFGRLSPEDVTRSFPAIRGRAGARIAAEQRETDPERNLSRDVVIERDDRAYLSYFGMREIALRHRRNDGTMSNVLQRGGLMQGHAVVVLPYDPRRDAVLLVEQFRAPVFMIGDPAPWMWEPVAGMIDPGETAEQAAHRESMEEAHIALDSLVSAGKAYSSSGSSTEFLNLFVGLADLSTTVDNGGLESEGEDIRSRILPFEELMDLVDREVLKDLPLLAIANWLARHRDRLRKAA